MRALRTVVAFVALLAAPASLAAQCATSTSVVQTDCDVWIDTNQDGLPGPDQQIGIWEPTTFDVWINSKEFQYTYFQVWLTFGESEDLYFTMDTTYMSVYWQIDGGVADPLDIFTHPYALGMTGFGFRPHVGIQRIAKVETRALRTAPHATACVTPIVVSARPTPSAEGAASRA